MFDGRGNARMRHGDWVAAVAVGVLALLSAAFFWHGQAPAAQLEIHCADNTVAVYSLSQVRSVAVTGQNGVELTVDIENGRARVRESTCPDQVCVNSGWLSRSGQTAACVPAGVYICVTGGTPTVDGVTA